MQHHDPEDRYQGFVAIGVLHNRYAEQYGIGKKGAETDCHGLSRPSAKQKSGKDDAGKETGKAAKVESRQHPKLECLSQIQIDHGAEQKDGYCKTHGECAELVRQAFTEIAGLDCKPACGQDDEDRQNDNEGGQQVGFTAVGVELRMLRG